MNSLNQIILEGNVTRQPEAKSLPSGTTICTLPVAVNRWYKNGEGKQEEEVSYFDIDTFGNLADACVKWCPKGRGIRVVGRLKQNRWKDEAGAQHSRVMIIAEHVEFKPFLKKNNSEQGDNAPLAADLGNPPKSKKEKFAMLAEAAAAAQQEQESAEVVF